MLDCDIHKNILDVSVLSVDTLNMKLLVMNKYQQTRKNLTLYAYMLTKSIIFHPDNY